MRKLLLIPMLALAGLVAMTAGCDRETLGPEADQAADVAALESGQSPAFAAAAVKRQAFCTSVTFAGPAEPPNIWMTGKVQHFCAVNQWAHGQDLVGIATHSGCATTNTVTGILHGQGPLAMELTEAFGQPVTGGFEGHWLLVRDGTQAGGKWWGKGYGDFEGTKMLAELDFDASSPPYIVCGYIQDPQGG